jgi:hypothetical protein
MNTRMPELVCGKCGSNRFKFPHASRDTVRCEDCGEPMASLPELQDKIANGKTPAESRDQRLDRHAKEVARSHAQLRASVAETDRLIVRSNEMLRRHRKEDEDAGD